MVGRLPLEQEIGVRSPVPEPFDRLPPSPRLRQAGRVSHLLMTSFLKRYSAILVFLSFLALAAILHFSSPNVPDPDSFYHIRHAWLYRTDGLLQTDFPWTQFSVIRTLSADLWYGFHILLIPFTFGNLVLGIKIAGIFLTAIFLYSLYWILKRSGVLMAIFWPLLAIFSAPNILFRSLMMRPHLVSLSLSALLFYFLASGSSLGIFLMSFGISWFHLSLAWISPLLAGTVAVVQWWNEKRITWRGMIFVALGTVAGWLLRPNPIGALKLAYIQVAKLILDKQSGLPLLFGTELYPLDSVTLFSNFLLFLLLWLSASWIFIAWFKRRYLELKDFKIKTLILASAVLAPLFFLLTMIVARRAHDFWILFGIIFIALVFSNFLRAKSLNNTKMVLGVVFIFLIFYSGIKTAGSLNTRAVKPELYREVSGWLKENSSTGDIVFNVRWSDFAMLFFNNQKNYYIGGMDPIFQYAYNPSLYWKFHYLSADDVTKKTCGADACTKEILEDTYEVLTRDFNARYVVLEKSRNSAVNYYLSSDPHYEKKFETERDVVYLIKR